MKKERDRQAKIAEEKKQGKGSKYHPCSQTKKDNKNTNTLKKNLEKKGK